MVVTALWHRSYSPVAHDRNPCGIGVTALWHRSYSPVMSAGANWERGTASLCPLSMWRLLVRWTSTSGLSCATSRSASCKCTWPRYPLYCCSSNDNNNNSNHNNDDDDVFNSSNSNDNNSDSNTYSNHDNKFAFQLIMS